MVTGRLRISAERVPVDHGEWLVDHGEWLVDHGEWQVPSEADISPMSGGAAKASAVRATLLAGRGYRLTSADDWAAWRVE